MRDNIFIFFPIRLNDWTDTVIATSGPARGRAAIPAGNGFCSPAPSTYALLKPGHRTPMSGWPCSSTLKTQPMGDQNPFRA